MESSIVNRSKNISHLGDPSLERFVQVEGHHLKLSSGLPFVLPMNGGQILVHVVEQLETQNRQDDVPVILYVEPGPNVSTLDSGAYFTVFICGTLFLVQVLRVLRRPQEAVTIDLPSQSSAGPVIPESESLRDSSCTGSDSLPSPAGSPQRQFCIPNATFKLKAQRPSQDLDSLPSRVEEPDCILVDPMLSMQAPIPTRVLDSELLSPDYGWTRTTSPLPLKLEDEHGSPSRSATPRAKLTTVHGSSVCPLRTPDTPGQTKTESLTAQYGSLLARDHSEISEHEIDEAHKLKDVWPAPFWPVVGAAELRKNVTPTVGSPASSLGEGPSSKMRLSRILGTGLCQGPEGRGKYASLKPDLDPKVPVAPGNGGGGLCHSPLPAPIGTGRPLGTPPLPPVSQPFLNSPSVLPDNSFGGQPFAPFSIRVDSTRKEYSAVPGIVKRPNLPAADTVKHMDRYLGMVAFVPCCSTYTPLS